MRVIETLLCIMVFTLCLITSRSDIKEGIIYNKVLGPFAFAALVLDVIFYGFLSRELFYEFAGNVVILVLISLILFYSHSFAGGDCKLIIVIALLYPASNYYQLNGNSLTLYFALGLGIFYGYVYLLCDSVLSVIREKSRLSMQYIKLYLINFLKSFFSGLIYITLINWFINIGSACGFTVNAWFTRFICLLVAWVLGKYPVLRRWYLVLGIMAVDVVLCMVTKFVPINIHPENYILVIALLLCQIIIRTNLYETKPVKELKKGMILSAQASIVMQNSRVKGLPGISQESLKNRLTEEEVESIQRWAKYRSITTITIVRKIPFAVFISFGFFSYFIIWSLL